MSKNKFNHANHTEGSASQIPNTKRIYIEGERSGIRVPFREIGQHLTRGVNGAVEENETVRVYETSGPWGDPGFRGDVRDGLPPLRLEWIHARQDIQEYEG